jgi:hypothetical protein
MLKVAVGTTDGELDDESAALANFHGTPLRGKEGTRRFAVPFALVLTLSILTNELVGRMRRRGRFKRRCNVVVVERGSD